MSEMCCTRLARNTGRKNRHLGVIGVYRQLEKNLLSSSNTFSTCPHNMVNFGQLTAEIGSGVCGTPANFNGFRSSSGRQPNCGVEQRAPPIFVRAAITLGIGPHSSSYWICRQQRVRAGAISQWLTLNVAMPQGSWLGPISFLVMIDDLAPGITHKYVDDTTLTEVLKSTDRSSMQNYFL